MKNNLPTKLIILLSVLPLISMLWLSCDDRTPTKSSATGPIPVYKLAVNYQSTALDNSQNAVLVGEDIEGPGTFTRITAHLTDEKNVALTGRTVVFSAVANGQPTGLFVDVGEKTVDENGFVQVDFVDSGPAMDNPGTPTFEGVIVTATFTQEGFPTNPDTTVTFSKTIQFDVIDTSVTQVWPYRVLLTPDPDVIYTDDGETKSQLKVSLRNNVYKPLEGLLVQFVVNPDTIGLLDIPYVVTDTSGKGTVEFTNTGDPNLTGTVNITASFFHPQFGTTYHTRQVSIINPSDQTPVYLSLTAQPVSGPASSPVIVGEDVNDSVVDSSGNPVRTKITTRATDENGTALSAIQIRYFAIIGSDTTEDAFDYNQASTNSDGYTTVNFFDNGQSAIDNIATPEYEGVTIIAYIGDNTATTQFNVYAQQDDVWPYHLYLNVDNDVIYVDGGITKSIFSVTVKNKDYLPLENLQVQFEANPDTIGFFNSGYIITDSLGQGSVDFLDTGDPNMTGTVNVTASFLHPQFGTAYHTRQVSIIKSSSQTLVNLSLTAQPVSGPASSPVIVGEDVNDSVVDSSNNPVRTKITTRATDESGTALSGVQIRYFAIIGSDTTGDTFDYNQASTNSEGYTTVNFFDNGQSAVDNIATPEYEGVTIVAYIGDNTATAQFNVYAQQEDVWPYHIYLNVDNDVIYVDGGITKSLFSVTVKNKDYLPLENLQVQFEANPDTIGFFNPGYTITDALGQGSVEYLDTGDPDLTGSVEVIARFVHPLFGTISKDKQISVIEQEDGTVVNLSLTAQPVVGSNTNFVFVGEDVKDTAPAAIHPVRSRITALVTDAAGEPISGKLVEFLAIFGSDTTENNFDLEYVTTDAQGLAWVNFYDNGQSAIDSIGTPTYEGVTVVGYIDNLIATTRFNVYDQVSDVWPYRLNLYKDRDFINLDNGLTKAEITVVLSNRLNKPLKNIEITFSASLGFINDVSQTDTTGTAIEYFTDLGDPGDVGISTIRANYQHPSFELDVTDSLQISIIDPSTSGIPAYIVIPASHPGDIMVSGGGGLESTNICAQVFDENGLLVDIPTEVTFELGPATPLGAVFSNDLGTITTTSTDGIACVSLNSGTNPGPVYITASIGDSIFASSIPVIIVTGPAFNIHPQVAGTSISPIDGGLYQIETSALVYDLHGNPVADSTYVYWSMDVAPSDSDDTLHAAIIGVSFTNNESINGDSYPGIAYSYLIYTSDGIFDWASIYAYTYGDSGVVVGSYVEDDVIMPYYGDNLLLTSNMVYWDFSLMPDPAVAMLTATLTDHYGVPVEGGRIQFLAPGGTVFGANPALTDENGQAGVMVQWAIGICAPIASSEPQQYESFTSSCVAMLLDPMPITSDPLDILLVRTYQLPNPPANGADDSIK